MQTNGEPLQQPIRVMLFRSSEVQNQRNSADTSENLLFSEHEVMWIVYLARLAQRGTRTKRQARNPCGPRSWLVKKSGLNHLVYGQVLQTTVRLFSSPIVLWESVTWSDIVVTPVWRD